MWEGLDQRLGPRHRSCSHFHHMAKLTWLNQTLESCCCSRKYWYPQYGWRIGGFLILKKSDFELAIIRLGINNSELYATEMHLMLVTKTLNWKISCLIHVKKMNLKKKPHHCCNMFAKTKRPPFPFREFVGNDLKPLVAKTLPTWLWNKTHLQLTRCHNHKESYPLGSIWATSWPQSEK